MNPLRPEIGRPVRHLYLHIPFCRRICPYCAFYKHTPGAAGMMRFADALLAELDHHLKQLAIVPRTVYFGGGTPSMLSPKVLGKVFDGLRARLDFSGLEEWTMEANPRTFDAGKIHQCVDAGVTRVSLGVQSWNPRHLAILGRDHSPGDAAKAYDILRRAGVPAVNIDHMFALPGQSPREWEEDLDATIALAPDHISTYNLTYEEDTAFMERFQRGEYHQDADADSVFFELAHDKLVAAGFAHYETSNFAAAGGADFRSRHNRACWQGADYLGLGPGAVSTVHGRRWTNVPDTGRYTDCAMRFGTTAGEIEVIDDPAWLVERIALELRTAEGMRLALLDAARQAVARGLAADGLVVMGEERMYLSEKGRLLADAVAASLI